MVSETNLAQADGIIAGRLAWLRVSQTQALLRFLAIVGLVCAVACVYLWQANRIDDIRDSTDRLNARALELERQNAALMIQLAAWDRPDTVAAKAGELGMVPAAKTAYTQVALPDAHSQAVGRPNDVVSWWQELVQEIARRWSGVTRTANLAAESK